MNKLTNINMIIRDMDITYASRENIYVQGDMIDVA